MDQPSGLYNIFNTLSYQPVWIHKYDTSMMILIQFLCEALELAAERGNGWSVWHDESQCVTNIIIQNTTTQFDSCTVGIWCWCDTPFDEHAQQPGNELCTEPSHAAQRSVLDVGHHDINHWGRDVIYSSNKIVEYMLCSYVFEIIIIYGL